jgi:SAM-dependent methyltransferase
MLRAMQAEAKSRSVSVPLVTGAIDALPLEDGAFDLVLAAHVLYHVGDLAASVRELARVMHSDGVLLATTNSSTIEPLLLRLHTQAVQRLGLAWDPPDEDIFTLENGADVLHTMFDTVRVHVFEDKATFPGVNDFLALYRTLGRYRDFAPAERDELAREVRHLADNELAHSGALCTPVLMGAFVCQNRRA